MCVCVGVCVCVCVCAQALTGRRPEGEEAELPYYESAGQSAAAALSAPPRRPRVNHESDEEDHVARPMAGGRAAANGGGGAPGARPLGTTSQRVGLLYGMEDSAAARADPEAGENKETVADHVEYTVRKQLLSRFYFGVCGYLIVSISEWRTHTHTHALARTCADTHTCKCSRARTRCPGTEGHVKQCTRVMMVCVCVCVLALFRSGDHFASILQCRAAEYHRGAAVPGQVRVHIAACLGVQVRRGTQANSRHMRIQRGSLPHTLPLASMPKSPFDQLTFVCLRALRLDMCVCMCACACVCAQAWQGLTVLASGSQRKRR